MTKIRLLAVLVIAQLACACYANYCYFRVRKARDEIKLMQLDTAKQLDATSLTLEQMKTACGIAREARN